MDADNFPPQTRTNDMAKGNSQKKSDGTVPVIHRIDANLWKFEMPPVNNANYVWIQHFIHHLSLVGVAVCVLANGSRSSSQSSEGEIHQQWRAKYDPAN